MKNNDTIVPLKGPDRVRKRPSGFFSSVDADGCMSMFLELLDYSVQEYQLGFANKIFVSKLADGSYIIEDNGAGIPIEYNPKKGICDWEEVFSGKFPKQNGDTYTFYLGNEREHKLRAILQYDRYTPLYALFAGTAASRFMNVRVFRDGCEYTLHFNRGHLVGDVNKICHNSHRHGTRLHFLPDDEVFSSISFDLNKVAEYASQQAALNPGLSIMVNDYSVETLTKREFLYPDGFAGYMTEKLSQKDAIFPISRLCWRSIIDDEYVSGRLEPKPPYHAKFEMVLSYTPGSSIIEFYHNYKRMENCGVHQKAVENAFRNCVNANVYKTTHLRDFSILISTVSERTSWETGRQTSIANKGIGDRLTIALENALPNHKKNF